MAGGPPTASLASGRGHGGRHARVWPRAHRAPPAIALVQRAKHARRPRAARWRTCGAALRPAALRGSVWAPPPRRLWVVRCARARACCACARVCACARMCPRARAWVCAAEHARPGMQACPTALPGGTRTLTLACACVPARTCSTGPCLHWHSGRLRAGRDATGGRGVGTGEADGRAGKDAAGTREAERGTWGGER